MLPEPTVRSHWEFKRQGWKGISRVPTKCSCLFHTFSPLPLRSCKYKAPILLHATSVRASSEYLPSVSPTFPIAFPNYHFAAFFRLQLSVSLIVFVLFFTTPGLFLKGALVQLRLSRVLQRTKRKTKRGIQNLSTLPYFSCSVCQGTVLNSKLQRSLYIYKRKCIRWKDKIGRCCDWQPVFSYLRE